MIRQPSINEQARIRISAKMLKKFLEQTYPDAFVMIPGRNPEGEEISVRCLEYHCNRGRVYVHTRNPDWDSYDAQDKECNKKT